MKYNGRLRPSAGRGRFDKGKGAAYEPRMKALSDIRVLELGQLLAGPFAGATLAGFGAEVIKVEPPGTGDPMRGWRKLHEGTSLWWYSLARNKKSITLDLRNARAAAILKRLSAQCDVIIENFRPGRMEEWGLGYDELSADNPGLVMVRISGWGQSGPYAQRPGFASVAEGIGGLRYIVGDPDRPPVRTGLSIGDSLAGVHAVMGTMIALHERARTGRGQVVDTAIYESVFNMMESTLPEYDRFGHVRERSGARLSGIVPTNTYGCADGKYVIIGGNGDSIFRRLMQAIGRSDLASDARLADNPGRVKHEAEIDAAIEAFTSQRSFDEVYETLTQAEVPTGPIYSIADIASDPQYAARAMFDRVELPDGTPLKVPAYVPKLSRTPASTEWRGPTLGEHNQQVYQGLLGLEREELEQLAHAKVI
jgi:formyl-CoA transferase